MPYLCLHYAVRLNSGVSTHMSDSNSLLPDDHSEFELLYNVSVSDLAFFKQQQWTVTNHALVVMAGLVGIAKLLVHPLIQYEKWLLTVLVAATAAIGLFVLGRLQHSIEVRRRRLENVRAKFGTAFNTAWDIPKQKEYVVEFLVFIQLIAASLASWLLIFRL